MQAGIEPREAAGHRRWRPDAWIERFHAGFTERLQREIDSIEASL
jgi:hypothetical protein